MPKVGTANLPLHGGKAPRWLFKRMVKLSEGIIDAIILEHGVKEFFKRLSDPFWFQAFSCVLGFDWHSSGTTTVTCGALKQAINPEKHGIAINGGKGKASKKTLEEIEKNGDFLNISTKNIDEMKYSSRMAAKVDNNAIQDQHSLYHHVFIFSEKGDWNVIQQGINSDTKFARRYHWSSEKLEEFLNDPHDSILGKKNKDKVLDMGSKDSIKNQETCVDLVNDNPVHLKHDWATLNLNKNQKTLFNYNEMKRGNSFSVENLDMPYRINWKKMREIYEFQPENYEKMLSLKGVGSNTVRALALISDLIYGEKPSWEDPVKYSFAVGGKDGVPFPVDKEAMDNSADILKKGVDEAKLKKKEKIKALKRLKEFCKTKEAG
ncbi:MAG: DUF763 domain-containing protein [Candidatus Thermoplasmatota archaeon]